MRRPSVLGLFALLALGSLPGCNAILDNEPGELRGAPSECAAGLQCVPKAASGIYARIAASIQECPMGWEAAAPVTDGSDPGCGACACAGAAGGSCAPGAVYRWEMGTCTGLSGLSSGADGECVDLISGPSGFVVEPPIVAQGSCTPSTSSPTPVQMRTLCTFDAASAPPCGVDGVCVPDGGAGFGDACTLLPVESACDGPWGSKMLLYAGYADTRSCSCSCEPPSGGACAGAGITVYGVDACAGAPFPLIPAGSGCANTTLWDTGTSLLVSAGTWSGGTCASTLTKGGDLSFMGGQVLCCPN